MSCIDDLTIIFDPEPKIDIELSDKVKVVKAYNLIPLSIKNNGIFTADEGFAYNKVEVDVFIPKKVTKQIDIKADMPKTYLPNQGEVFESVNLNFEIADNFIANVRNITPRDINIVNGKGSVSNIESRILGNKIIKGKDINNNVDIGSTITADFKDDLIVKNGIYDLTQRDYFIKNLKVEIPSIKLETLNVTENKQYIAPEGTAYTTVNANVIDEQIIAERIKVHDRAILVKEY